MADSEVPEQEDEQSFVIEKTQEGVQFEEQQLPIDINYAKLADWLVDRKKVPADWRKRVVTIQTRINKLLPELPRGSNPDLLSLPLHSESSSVGFREAQKIRNILVAANPGDRTIFGGYSGVTGNWDSVVRAYESNLVFLGEASTILVQNTNYDIPFFRKQAAKCQQQLSDLDRKEAEFRKAAAASSQAFLASCKELGIEGKNIRSELKSLLHELPEVFSKAVNLVSSSGDIGTALQYYQQFMSSIHGQQGGEKALLPVLSAVREDPSAATCPDPEIQPHTTGSEDASSANASGINWDLSDMGISAEGGGSSGAGINWDLSGESSTPAIQWDFDMSASGAETASAPAIDWGADTATSAEGGSGPGGIQWDITPEASAGESSGANADVGIESSTGDTKKSAESGAPQIVWDFSIEDSGAGREDASGAAAEGAGSTSVDSSVGHIKASDEATSREIARHRLSQAAYRSQLVDDLYELRAFLRQRAAEMMREEGSPLQTQLLAEAPPGPLQELGAAGVRGLESAVREIIVLLTCRRTTDLLLIYSSSRYLDRLEESLKTKKGNEARLLGSIEDLNRKRLDLRMSLNTTLLKQDEAVRRTRAVKELVENTLSSQYNGRPVNIIGEINNQLGAGG